MDGRVPRDTKKRPQDAGTRPPRTLFCHQGWSTSRDAKFNFVNFLSKETIQINQSTNKTQHFRQ
eukprot:12912301-Ditylum_brightwellii.AAC.1